MSKLSDQDSIQLESIQANDNPVLNNPYEEPKYYYDTDMNGNIDYKTVKDGRRPYGYDVNIVPNRKGEQTIFAQDDFVSTD
ncbi:MAG: hypothetical protein Q4E49_03155, partial [Bacteroidales bacterium]|nr:hypothetical protein [Bacteroidales bacterium]